MLDKMGTRKKARANAWIVAASCIVIAVACGDDEPDEPDEPEPKCEEGHMPELCAGECVDIGNDEDNCGGCGNKCPAGHVCNYGACFQVGS